MNCISGARRESHDTNHASPSFYATHECVIIIHFNLNLDLLFFSKSRSIKKDAVTLLFPPVTHGRDQVRFENNSLFLMNAEEIKRVNECHNDIALGSDQNT